MSEKALQKTIQHNSSIDIARYVCAVMVVAIHARVFRDIHNGIWQFFNTVFFRAAVPFFFAVSGYFFIKNALGDMHKERTYLSRIIKTYALWSCLYLAEEFISDVIFGNVSIIGFIVSSVVGVFFTGSHYHFWYFPALIYSAILVILLHKLKIMKLLMPICVVLLMFGCLGCAYYGLGDDLPIITKLVNSSYYTVIRRAVFTGTPFFSCGYLIVRLEDMAFTKKKIFKIWCAVTAFSLLEMLVLYIADWVRWVNVSIGLYPFIIFTVLLLNANPMPKFYSSARFFRYLANFTYYSHPFFIIIFAGIFDLFGMKLSEMQTLKFVIIAVVTFVVGTCIYQLKFTKNSKKRPK